MRINKFVDINLRESPRLDKHFVIEVKNPFQDGALIEHFDTGQNKLRLRLTLETAILLAQFIDEQFDEVIEKEMTINV